MDSKNQNPASAAGITEKNVISIVNINPEGKIREIKQSIEFMIAYTGDKLVETELSEHFIETQRARDLIQELFKMGMVAGSQLSLRDKNGNHVEVLISGSIY